jgi:hypothetical protein
MGDATRTVDEPHDQLTRIADAMIETLIAHLEYTDKMRTMIFLDDGERGGIGLYNYENDNEAITDLILHLKAMFEANGKTVVIVPIGQG